MQIEISGQNVKVTDAMRQHVEQKMQKLDHLFNNITHVSVVLKVESKNMQKAEATVNMSHGQIFASSDTQNMYDSVNDMVKKLSSQVIKHKQKLQDHHNNDANKGKE